MWRIVWAVVSVLIWTVSVHGAREIDFNVDIFCGWDGYYRPMEWTPVEIGISTDLTEPFGGSFGLSARQDGLNTLNVIHSFVLTPDVPLPLPLVTKFAFGISGCDLTIRDDRGRVRWEHTVDFYDYSARLLRPVKPSDLLIGLIGQPQFSLLRLPQETVCLSDRGQGDVWLGRKVPRMVPRDWTGFVSLDLLILFDPDWTLLRAEQLNAIAEWVSNGGMLLLILGQHPMPQDSPLSEVIPFRLGEPRQVDLPAGVLVDWGLDPSQSETVTTWPVFPKPDALLAETVKSPGAGYLYGLGHAGFGRVAVLGFDPAELRDTQSGHAMAFWLNRVTACLHGGDRDVETRTAVNPGRRRNLPGRGRRIVLAADAPEDSGRSSENLYRISLAQSASNQVMEHLYQLRQMRPLSIWWIILTLSALAILLGPVDYLVLKRLDKLPYTWLTSTGWIILFTVGAYYGVQELRGGTMQFRAVSVIDGIADSNCAWATHYTGLFAPRSDDYRLDGLESSQWWSGVAPSREDVWAHSREAGMRQIHCVQADGANLPVSLPINIWTIQSLLGEFPVAAAPFSATVECGDGRIAGQIINRSDSPIRGGFVLLEDTYVDFGPVAARATQRFDGRSRPFNPWDDRAGYQYRTDRSGRSSSTFQGLDLPRYPSNMGERIDAVFLAQGCLNRTLAMHELLRFGAALVFVEFEDAPAPFGVRNRSYDVSHIQYARQLVFPRE